MANNNLTLQKITNEALLVLENQLTMTKQVNRDYQDQFAQTGAKIGQTLNIRKPVRYQGRVGPNLNVEDSVETSIPLTVGTQRGVDIEFSDAEMALDIDNFSDRYIKPAVALLANQIDQDVCALFSRVANIGGVPGVTPNANSTILQAGRVLKDNAVTSTNDLRLVVSPAMEASMVGANLTLFNPSKNISGQFENGEIGRALGFNWFMDQNVGVQTFGPGGGTPVVNGAGQTGYSLVTSGWTPSTQVLNASDVVYLAGVNAVNTVGKQNLNYLKAFCLAANVVSDSSGNATLTFTEPIIPATGATIPAPFGTTPVTLGSAHQNVSAAPASGAAITLFAAGHTGIPSPQALAFHKDAFTLACVDLPMVGGVDKCARVSDKQLGLSIRMIRDYLPATDQRVTRLDILYGLTCIRPEWAYRIAG